MRIQKPADLARIVKTQRQARGLTQQDVADAVGITRQSLARIERGHAGASFDTVLRVFGALAIHLDASSHLSLQVTDVAVVDGEDPQVAPAALVSARSIDPSGVIAAAYRSNINTSPLAAAAAATLDIDSSAVPSGWRTPVNDLSRQVQANASRPGSELDARKALQALLDAAIEVGDPDHRRSSETENIASVPESDGERHGRRT